MTDVKLYISGNNCLGHDMDWCKKQHSNTSDENGDGLLNLTEFNMNFEFCCVLLDL